MNSNSLKFTTFSPELLEIITEFYYIRTRLGGRVFSCNDLQRRSPWFKSKPSLQIFKKPRTSGLFIVWEQLPGNGFIKALVEKSASQATGETISEHSDDYPQAGLSRSNTTALLARRVKYSRIKAKKGGGGGAVIIFCIAQKY